MNELVQVGFGLLLLFLTLSFALSYLAGPLSFLKKAGVIGVLRCSARTSWRFLVFVFQHITRTRRLNIRPPGARHAVRRAG